MENTCNQGGAKAFLKSYCRHFNLCALSELQLVDTVTSMIMRGSWAQPLRVVGTVQKQARQVTIHYRHHSYYQHHHYSELEMDCCAKQPFNSEIRFFRVEQNLKQPLFTKLCCDIFVIYFVPYIGQETQWLFGAGVKIWHCFVRAFEGFVCTATLKPSR